MGMNQTPSGERVHIAFFGRRNAGKSSLVNAVTGQELAIVSDVKGTTTDPVYKSMELLPLGPVVMIDTPGLDDEGELGEKRVKKARQVLDKTDIAVLVVDAAEGKGHWEDEMIRLIEKKEVPCLVVYNKADLPDAGMKEREREEQLRDKEKHIWVSAVTGQGIAELKEKIAGLYEAEGSKRQLAADLVEPGGLAVLVVPIDKAAPKGRLILPQQQVIRDLLDKGAGAVVCRETELAHILDSLKEDPSIVITDSQVFPIVDSITPKRIRLTSFSILFARYKGNLEQSVKGAYALNRIRNGSRILISEGCTHHRQCGDIGTVKLPAWIREYTGCEPVFEFTSGTEFPEDISGYGLIVHCGGCMLNEREMGSRLRAAKEAQIPMTNYGILIAYMKGILERSIEGLGLKL